MRFLQIQNPMPLDPRVEFHRVIIKSSIVPVSGSDSMLLKAYTTGGQRSSRAASSCEANGLVVLPSLPSVSDAETASTTRKTRLEKGEFGQAVLIGEIEME
jgi:gephyrin